MEHAERLSTFTHQQLLNERSLDFCRLVSAWHDTNNLDAEALKFFAGRWPGSLSLDLVKKAGVDLKTKAGVDAGTTYTPGWAAPLASLKPLADGFVKFARPASLLGKLDALVNHVPFNVSVPAQMSGSSYAWIGQGAPKVVGNLQLASTTLPIAKASGIIIVTDELLRLAQPNSVITLRRELVRGLAHFLDTQLVDHTIAAVANVSPGSITNLAPSFGSAGTSAANAATDLKKLLAQFTTTNPNVESIAVLTSPGLAAAIAIATNSTTLGIDGGSIYGCPVFTSTAVGGRLVALDPTALLLADDDGINVSVSHNATVEMSTATTSPVTAGTVIVGLWGLNLVGIRVDRMIAWKMARPDSVLYTNVAYT